MRTVPTPRAALAAAATAPLLWSRLPETSGGQPLPERLRWVLEQLSGYDLSDVRVYRSSPWPARVGARAFAIGTDIHLSIEAEDSLEHEAWHVVQQKQGRVRATRTVSPEEPQLGGVGLNAEEPLEREAEAMGRIARSLVLSGAHIRAREKLRVVPILRPVVQRNAQIGQAGYSQRKDLLKDVLEALAGKARNFPPDVLGSILTDLITEGRSFPTMKAALQEIAIRNVGYQVEARARRLMEEQQQILNDSRTRAMQGLDQAARDWTEDQLKPLDERRFFDKHAYDKECLSLLAGVKESSGCLFWGNASYFTSSKAFEQPLARWVLRDQDPYPDRMNCWEFTAYSLVRTGLVGRDYLAWCDLGGSPNERPSRLHPSAPWPLLINQAIKIRDYFWCTTAGTMGYEADRMVSQPNRRDLTNSLVSIPLDVTIPKGRLVILGQGAHVALSTGRKRRIQSQDARDFFGRDWGHGLLELDDSEGGGLGVAGIAKLETARETTVEDLLRMAAIYLNHVIVAPFPDVPQGQLKRFTKTVTVREQPEIAQIMQAFLARNQTRIDAELTSQRQKDDEAISKLEKDMEGMDQALGRYKAAVIKLKNLRNSVEGAPARLKEKWEKSAFNSPPVQAALRGMNTRGRGLESNVETTISLNVAQTDLYYGLADFGTAKS